MLFSFYRRLFSFPYVHVSELKKVHCTCYMCIRQGAGRRTYRCPCQKLCECFFFNCIIFIHYFSSVANDKSFLFLYRRHIYACTMNVCRYNDIIINGGEPWRRIVNQYKLFKYKRTHHGQTKIACLYSYISEFVSRNIIKSLKFLII